MVSSRPRKRLYKLVALLLLVFGLLQLFRPPLSNPPVTGDIDAPPEVKAILVRACYDCHSNQTNLRWYDKVMPVYWQVAHHVEAGRIGLNFSTWNNLKPAEQKGKLWEAVNQVIAGAMPLSSYERVHPDSKISAEDLAVLKAYLSSLAPVVKVTDTAALRELDEQQLQATHWPGTASLPVALNGVSFIPDYKNWLPISTTERFDNGTMRVILGNDIAVKAVRENNINPWPKGSIFAKVAWNQVSGADSTIRTGAFEQVEFMIKDAQKYASTAGWGWARFKTTKMLPYGKTALFTSECVNCHQPVADRDFVFTSPINH